MAHPEGQEAAVSPAQMSVADKAAHFEEFIDLGDEEAEIEDTEASEDEFDGEELPEDDLELDEEQEDEADEPETAIEAPVSLNASEKEAFAAATPEVQQAWAEAEKRRNTQVQEATTKASQAQREAESRAAAADAEAKARYAQQLEAIGQQLLPVAPDRRQYRDDASYLVAAREYDQQVAQHNSFMQQVAGLAQEADAQMDEQFIQQRDRELMQIPEVANPETRGGYLDRAFGMAEQLGYDKAQLAKTITAQEVKALNEIAEWKDKASKYDNAMQRKMQKVRSAKGKSLRPNAAPQGKPRAARADQAWKRVTSTKDRTEQANAFADYLEATGNL